MKKRSKTKLILPSLLAILGCAATISGSTYSLFTSEATSNIVISSGKVALTSSISNLKGNVAVADTEGTLLDENNNKYRWGEEINATGEDTKTLNYNDGSSVSIDSNGDLTVSNFHPGHKFSFEISLTNSSNIDILYNLSYKLASEDDKYKEFLSDLNISISNLNGSNETKTLNGKVSYTSNWIKISKDSTDSIPTITVEIEYPISKTTQHEITDCKLVFAVNGVQANGGTENEGEESKGYSVTKVSSGDTINVTNSDDNNEVKIEGTSTDTYTSDITVAATNATVTLSDVKAEASTEEADAKKVTISGENTTLKVDSSSSLKNYTIEIPASAKGTTIEIASDNVENITVNCAADDVTINVTSSSQITLKDVSATGKSFTLTGNAIKDSSGSSSLDEEVSLLNDNKETSLYNVKVEGKITLGDSSNVLDKAVIEKVEYKASGTSPKLESYVKDLTIKDSYFDLNNSDTSNKVNDFIVLNETPNAVNISNNTFNCENVTGDIIVMDKFTSNTTYSFKENTFKNLDYSTSQAYRFKNTTEVSGVTIEIENNAINATKSNTNILMNTPILLEENSGNKDFANFTFKISSLDVTVDSSKQTLGSVWMKSGDSRYISNCLSVYKNGVSTSTFPKVIVDNKEVSEVSDKEVVTSEDRFKELLGGTSNVDIVLGSGTFNVPDEISNDNNKNKTVKVSGSSLASKIRACSSKDNGGDKRVIYARGSNIEFEGVTIVGNSSTWSDSNAEYSGIQVGNGSITYRNCVIDGVLTLYGKNVKFINCTFNTPKDEYAFYTWGGENIELDGCTLNVNSESTKDKAIKIYGGSNTTLSIKNSAFNVDSNIANKGYGVCAINTSMKGNVVVNVDSVSTCTNFQNGTKYNSGTTGTPWASDKDSPNASDGTITVNVNNHQVYSRTNS